MEPVRHEGDSYGAERVFQYMFEVSNLFKIYFIVSIRVNNYVV